MAIIMVDERDKRIIEILRKDARTANTEIAQKLDISEAAVRNRVNELQDKGVIKRFTIDVDPRKLGFNSIAIVGADVEPDCFLEAAEKLAEFDEVRDISLTTGDHMIMMEIWAEDEGQLTTILSEKVGKVEGIQRICPAVVLENLKNGF